jgi:hypothetical protein
VRADRASIESFLDLADDLAEETDHDVIDGLAAALSVLDDQVAEGPAQEALRRWIGARFGPALAKVGWAASARESDDVRLRRAALLRRAGGVAEAPRCWQIAPPPTTTCATGNRRFNPADSAGGGPVRRRGAVRSLPGGGVAGTPAGAAPVPAQPGVVPTPLRCAALERSSRPRSRRRTSRSW